MTISVNLGRASCNARVAGLVLTFLQSLTLSGCHSSEHATEGATHVAEVGVARVLVEPTREWNEFNGRIRAIDAVEIRARVSGYIQSVAFTEGEMVKQGDLLFLIDPRPYRAALESAIAQLERARATTMLAQAEDHRAQTLVHARATSEEEAETRRATYVQSQADVRAAEAAVTIAKLNLGYTAVRAPITGRASRAMLTLGNLAIADQSILTSVVSQDPVYVDFDPDEQTYLSWRHASAVHEGRHGESAYEVRVGLADETGFPHAGTVDFLDNHVDASTGTLRVRAVLRNPERVLEPGLFARVQLAATHVVDAMLIDDKAVLTDQDRKYVYVVGPGGRALRKEVHLGRLTEGLRVVESGLSPDDRVVVEGLQKIFFSGAPVKAREITVESSTAGAAAVSRHDSN